MENLTSNEKPRKGSFCLGKVRALVAMKIQLRSTWYAPRNETGYQAYPT